MKAKTLWLWCVAWMLLGFTACNDQPLLDRNEAITERRWFREQQPEFRVEVDDTATAYDVFINLRNSIDFQFSDLFLEVQQKQPDSSSVRYAIKIKMTNREGLWIGQGSGNIYSQQVRFLINYHFPDTGTYTFKIKQNMRVNPVEGINDIGIRIGTGAR